MCLPRCSNQLSLPRWSKPNHGNDDQKPGINFISILQIALMHLDPKSTKKDWLLVSIFLRLRDLRAKKAACSKMLMKLTPEDFPHHRLIGLPSISPTLNERIFVRMSFGQLFPPIRNVHVTRKKAAKTTSIQKTRAYNVDEIDTWKI